jgi:hypothetical protein
MKRPNRDELSLRIVLALPEKEMISNKLVCWSKYVFSKTVELTSKIACNIKHHPNNT